MILDGSPDQESLASLPGPPVVQRDAHAARVLLRDVGLAEAQAVAAMSDASSTFVLASWREAASVAPVSQAQVRAPRAVGHERALARSRTVALQAGLAPVLAVQVVHLCTHF